MATRWLVLAAVLLPCAHAAAQQRKPCFVTVVDAGDRPLAGAEVTLVDDGFAGASPIDVVRATTDERGRCRPALAVGRLYTLWAIGGAAADGSRATSEPIDHVACGAVVEVHAPHRWTHRRARLVESEATRTWWSRGLHVLGPDATTLSVLAVDADGTAALPAAPWAPLRLGIRDETGALLQVCAVAPDAVDPEARYPAPDLVRYAVRGQDGAPVAGAEAAVPLHAREVPRDRAWPPPIADNPLGFRTLARSARDGSLVVPLHGTEARRASTWLRVGAAGRAARYVRAVRSAAGDAAATTLQLDPQRTFTVRWRARTEGQLAARAHVAVRELTATGSHTLETRVRGTFTGVDVTFELPSACVARRLVVQSVPTTETSAPACAVVPLEGAAGPSLDIDSAHLRHFPLRLVDAGGSPAPHARVAVLASHELSASVCATMLATASGRAELAAGDTDVAVYATAGDGHAVLFVAADRHAGEIVLTLAPMPTLHCRAVDADGTPVHGARIEQHGSFSGMGGRQGGAEGWTREWIGMQIAWPAALRARSGRDGVLLVPVQDWKPWTTSVCVRAGERASAPFPLQAGDDLGDVVVR